MPSTGLIRTYTQAVIDSRGEYIYVGTTAGEVAIYSIVNQVFKAAIPVFLIIFLFSKTQFLMKKINFYYSKMSF